MHTQWLDLNYVVLRYDGRIDFLLDFMNIRMLHATYHIPYANSQKYEKYLSSLKKFVFFLVPFNGEAEKNSVKQEFVEGKNFTR